MFGPLILLLEKIRYDNFENSFILEESILD